MTDVSWRSMAHRIRREQLFVAVPNWRSVQVSGTTIGSPAKEAVFLGNWRNYTGVSGNDVAYYKDPFGVVHITGACEKTSAVTTNDLIMTLPADCRPRQAVQWMGMAGTKTNGVSVSRMVVLPYNDATNPGTVIMQGYGTTGPIAGGAPAADATIANLIILEVQFRTMDNL